MKCVREHPRADNMKMFDFVDRVDNYLDQQWTCPVTDSDELVM